MPVAVGGDPSDRLAGGVGAEGYVPVIDEFDVSGAKEGQVTPPGLRGRDPDQVAAVEHVVGGAAQIDMYAQIRLVDEPGAVVTRRSGAAPAVRFAGLGYGVVISSYSQWFRIAKGLGVSGCNGKSQQSQHRERHDHGFSESKFRLFPVFAHRVNLCSFQGQPLPFPALWRPETMRPLKRAPNHTGMPG